MISNHPNIQHLHIMFNCIYFAVIEARQVPEVAFVPFLFSQDCNRVFGKILSDVGAVFQLVPVLVWGVRASVDNSMLFCIGQVWFKGSLTIVSMDGPIYTSVQRSWIVLFVFLKLPRIAERTSSESTQSSALIVPALNNIQLALNAVCFFSFQTCKWPSIAEFCLYGNAWHNLRTSRSWRLCCPV